MLPTFDAIFTTHHDCAPGGGRRRHHGGGGRGPGGPGGPGWGGPGRPGWGGPGAPPWGGPGWFGGLFGGRHRARRGNVRAAILSVLGDQPHNGYQIMQAIEQRSQGAWRPSSGSIYPTLQLLEDEGLVEVEDARASQGSSRTYKLTAKGKRYVDEHRDELEAEWQPEDDARGMPLPVLMTIFRDVAQAAMQVASSGTPAQVEEAKRLLADVRRKLYGILAEEPEDE